MNQDLFKRLYAQQVLGVQHYICPQSIRQLRQIEGAWADSVLVVLLEPLLPSQKDLLKKIMSSIAIDKYSLLHIKKQELIKALFSESLSPFIFLFGLKDNSYNIPKNCFYTSYSLKELEGSSLEVKNKKQALWQELKQFNSSILKKS